MSRKRCRAVGQDCAPRELAAASQVAPSFTPTVDKAGRTFRIVKPTGAHAPFTLQLRELFMAKWTTADIPDQTGRVAVITGSNTGLGYETAAALAAKGAHVVIAVRNLDKGKDAAGLIHRRSPNADVALQELDLTSLDSIRAAAEKLRATHDHIDLLINNAGLMYTPKSQTKDGFEMQFGTNHLGHFAFTGLLLDRLPAGAGSRVVWVSSMGHPNRADIPFDN